MRRSVTFSSEDAARLLLQAFRYAVGRDNHLQPWSDVFAFLHRHADVLPDDYLRQIIDDCSREPITMTAWGISAANARGALCAAMTRELELRAKTAGTPAKTKKRTRKIDTA